MMTEVGGCSSRIQGLDVLPTFVLVYLNFVVTKVLEGPEDFAPTDFSMVDLAAHVVEQLVCYYPMLLKSRAVLSRYHCALVPAVGQ